MFDEHTLIFVTSKIEISYKVKKGPLSPGAETARAAGTLDYKGFSGPSYFLCVSSTTVSIPFETKDM